MNKRNIDLKTVEGFGHEWHNFDQTDLQQDELNALFERYFEIFPLDELAGAEGFDLGCGSGRWAALVAPKVGRLHCIDPAQMALEVSQRRLAHRSNVEFHLASVDEIPLLDSSQDFGYSLGVLHHIPNTEAALSSCVRKLKPGAPFLLYLYYSLDNRSRSFRALWWVSNMARSVISRLPFRIRLIVCNVIAFSIYLPLARFSRLLGQIGFSTRSIPLSAYQHSSFYTMKTDALDRFGTRLEQRFSRQQIHAMMRRSGLENVKFSEKVPYWVACGSRRKD